ncbi:MAG: DUF1844 domain-containing protein [Pirellulales bacterium]|nr:DUF1844 domain-containing protein [Pirellulales bacterium]
MADETTPKIIIDEDWKSQVQREKEALAAQHQGTAPTQPAAAAAPEAAIAPEPEAAAAHPGAATGQASSAPRGPLPPASLTILITGLVHQTSMLLEETLQLEGPARDQQLDDARHVIDLLQVLEDKTKGNLTDDESRLLSQALHEMRMAFVAVRDHPERFRPQTTP